MRSNHTKKKRMNTVKDTAIHVCVLRKDTIR